MEDLILINPTSLKQDFINKAKAKFGDRFDYSKVKYKNKETLVTIIDTTTGKEFQITPYNHLRGETGLPVSRIDTEEFIRRSKEMWGEDAYDYSKTHFIASKQPITLICRKHNYEFAVKMAQNHISKSNPVPTGCPICAREKLLIKLTELRRKRNANRVPKPKPTPKTEEEKAEAKRIRDEKTREHCQQRFVDKVHEMYGDKYDLSKAVYKGREDNVTLICPIHGEFEITPRSLFNGEKGKKPHGCYECEGIKRHAPALTEDVFRSRMKMLYGDRLDFSGSVFTSAKDKITFSCAKHGLQTVKTGSLMKGADCPRCAGRIKTLEDLIEQAKAVHGDRYDYSQTSLTRSEKGVLMMKDIRCKEHGLYTARVDVHIGQGGNCPRCAGYQNIISPAEHEAKYMDEARKVFGDRFDYSRVHYVNKRTPVWIRCKEHNRWFRTRLEDHVRGAGGCPDCVQSRGECLVRHYLEEHHIGFVQQYKIYHNNIFCNRQYLVIDFYVPQYNLFIEYNGKQHYAYLPYFHESKEGYTLADQEERDETVRLHCKKYGINLLEISYEQENNVNEILAEYFNKQNQTK